MSTQLKVLQCKKTEQPTYPLDNEVYYVQNDQGQFWVMCRFMNGAEDVQASKYGYPTYELAVNEWTKPLGMSLSRSIWRVQAIIPEFSA